MDKAMAGILIGGAALLYSYMTAGKVTLLTTANTALTARVAANETEIAGLLDTVVELQDSIDALETESEA